MAEPLPDGYAELFTLLADGTEIDSTMPKEELAAAHRDFRFRYLENHSFSEYGHLLVQVSGDIDATRSDALSLELGIFND